LDADHDPVVAVYEKRIAKLERKKTLAEEKLSTAGKPRMPLEESFEHALQLLSNLRGIRKTVPGPAFSEPVPYCRNQGR